MYPDFLSEALRCFALKDYCEIAVLRKQPELLPATIICIFDWISILLLGDFSSCLHAIQLSKLQRLQIRARKLIEIAKYKDGWNFNWLDVRSLISFDQGVMTYKILHGLCPDNLRHKFVERSMVSEYKTRNHRFLQIRKVRLEYAKRSFYFSCGKNWNDIPCNIREQVSLARFKKRFRKYLQNLQDPNTTPW